MHDAKTPDERRKQLDVLLTMGSEQEQAETWEELRQALEEATLEPLVRVLAGYGPVAAPIANTIISRDELVTWFVTHGWRESKSELVDRLLQDFVVVKR